MQQIAEKETTAVGLMDAVHVKNQGSMLRYDMRWLP